MSVQLILSIVLSLAVLTGISMMSKVKTAVNGNLLAALAMFVGVVATLFFCGVISAWTIYPAIIIGAFIGSTMARKVQMIQMPQTVALFNGLGGGASALVGIVSALGLAFPHEQFVELKADPFAYKFVVFTALLAVAIGMITLVGSLVAAGKLHRVLPQKPLIWMSHSLLTVVFLLFTICFIIIGTITPEQIFIAIFGCFVSASLFGLYFSVRVGGADMPITISLLNSLSGVAGSLAGMAMSDIFLVAVGGIVGASGLLLTQIMCRAMNRSLMSILLGSGIKASTVSAEKPAEKPAAEPAKMSMEHTKPSASSVLKSSESVIIVPGYGMALAQAQHVVRQLADTLERQGKRVRFAIHPVAGRMPGHMNVLLAEADIPYDKLFEMDQINDDFQHTDAVVVIGANDVLNPAAREAEGTPIYGMPVLNVDAAKHVIICNYDLNPGYAGVENPLYHKESGVWLELGDAKETLQNIVAGLNTASQPAAPVVNDKPSASSVLKSSESVIIVPGYGMALAQAQHVVRQLADTLERQGKRVRFAIHPVAGRMPGHMNVLLAEADIPYDKLFEMDQINDDFQHTDAVVVIGANDVLNPAAREAEGTPIYGMPVLNVDAAKHVIICNYDLNPGYAGVENPLYHKESGVWLELGDAKETLQNIVAGLM